MIEETKQQRRESVSSLVRQQSTVEPAASVAAASGDCPTNIRQQKQRRSLFSILFNPKNVTKSKPEEISESNNNNQSEDPIQEIEKTNHKPNKKKQDEDTDSYVLDLNDRLAIEKLYTQGNSLRLVEYQEQGGQLKVEQVDKKQPESTKPLGPPSMLAIRTPRVKPSAASAMVPATATSKGGRTCLLEPRFDSLGLSSDEEEQTVSSSASSASSAVDFTMDSQAPVKGLPDISMSEQDQRLFKWRLLAARTAWAAGSPISSDSELELLDCQSPALVIACSDDTSCSSVELIWTKPAANSRTRLQREDQELGEEEHLSGAATPATEVQQLPALKVNQEVAPLAGKARNLRQKLSIFELAKPMRGKNKTTPSPSQWVANPLFANANDDDGHEFCEDDNDNDKTDKRISSGSFIAQLNSRHDNRFDTKRRRGKKRWSSIRLKTEQYFSGGNNIINNNDVDHDGDDDDDDKRKSSPETGSLKQRDNIYLNHILNLDRKIKSNVSSIKSQLSETSKRASLLADQLLTSIKDTTKEQLFSHHSTGRRRKSSTLTSDFNAIDGQQLQAQAEQPFSLIYMHQQPVVTRQPRSTGCLGSLLASAEPQPSSRPSSTNVLMPSQELDCPTTTEKPLPSETGVEKKEQSSQTQTTSKSTGERSKVTTSSSRVKRLKRRRMRRQVNVARPTSSSSSSSNDEAADDDESFSKGKSRRIFKPRRRKVSSSQSFELSELTYR